MIATNIFNVGSDKLKKQVEDARQNKHYEIEPNVLNQYERSIDKFNKTALKAPGNNVLVTSHQIYHAINDSKPLTRYLAGIDVQFIPFISLLPDSIYDIVVKIFA